MPDYSELNPREIDELASIGLLNLVSLLIELDVERETFQPYLDMVNSAIAELAVRAEREKHDE